MPDGPAEDGGETASEPPLQGAGGRGSSTLTPGRRPSHLALPSLLAPDPRPSFSVSPTPSLHKTPWSHSLSPSFECVTGGEAKLGKSLCVCEAGLRAACVWRVRSETPVSAPVAAVPYTVSQRAGWGGRRPQARKRQAQDHFTPPRKSVPSLYHWGTVMTLRCPKAGGLPHLGGSGKR